MPKLDLGDERYDQPIPLVEFKNLLLQELHDQWEDSAFAKYLPDSAKEPFCLGMFKLWIHFTLHMSDKSKGEPQLFSWCTDRLDHPKVLFSPFYQSNSVNGIFQRIESTSICNRIREVCELIGEEVRASDVLGGLFERFGFDAPTIEPLDMCEVLRGTSLDQSMGLWYERVLIAWAYDSVVGLLAQLRRSLSSNLSQGSPSFHSQQDEILDAFDVKARSFFDAFAQSEGFADVMQHFASICP